MGKPKPEKKSAKTKEDFTAGHRGRMQESCDRMAGILFLIKNF